MELDESIRRQFSAAADAYLVSPVHVAGPDLERMIECAGAVAGQRVLDVGSGVGATALALGERGARVVALDLTPAMLDAARRQAAKRGLSDFETRVGDAAELPFDDASFDLVACRVCAHHFGRPRQALAEMARVVRPGSQILLIDSISPEEPAQDTFLNAIELLRDPSHVRNHKVSEWLGWFAELGLAAAHLHTFPTFLDFENWTGRMNTPEPERTQIRRLMDGATAEVRAAFGVGVGHSWSIPLALFRAVRRG